MEPRIRCDVCGQYIKFEDLGSGKALLRMVTPDSDLTSETWEALCSKHYKNPKEQDGDRKRSI